MNFQIVDKEEINLDELKIDKVTLKKSTKPSIEESKRSEKVKTEEPAPMAMY